jgi:uncharacterized protein YbbK (DUF523 family)
MAAGGDEWGARADSVGRVPLLVSACLVGLHTRLDARARSFPTVLALASRYCLIPVCPEQLGGSSTPRPPAEICGGAGDEVLDGHARVVTAEGRDITDGHLRGAAEVLAVARLSGATAAVLKARSPSCGVGVTYDGTFTHGLRPGSGVTAALLAREGITLCTEEDCSCLLAGPPEPERGTTPPGLPGKGESR